MSPEEIAADRPLRAVKPKSNYKQNEKILFSGDDVRVVSNIIDGARGVLVVSFPSADPKQGLDRPGFGSRWLYELGLSSVAVKVSYNHWFQTPEMDAALASIAAIAGDFDRVVTYGSSMGAYGAIACSKAVGAHTVLAVSPQWSIDPERIPWDRRWLEESSRIARHHGFVRDKMNEIATDGDVLVIADPWDIDAIHARHILMDVAKGNWISIPGSGHPAMSLLKEYKMVSRFMRSILIEGRCPDDWRAEIRIKRRMAQRYWLSLAKAAAARGTRGRILAAKAAKHALTLAEPSDKTVRGVAVVLMGVEDYEGAVSVLQQYAGLPDRSSLSMVVQADALLRLGRVADATSLVEQIAVIDPANKRLPGLTRGIARAAA